MLRITTSADTGTVSAEDTGTWRMKLEGKLAGPFVAEAEAAWKAAETANCRVEIDVTGVTCVDAGGESLLREMHAAGAKFLAEGVWMKALLSDVTGRAFRCRSFTKLRRLSGLLAILLMVQSAFAQDPKPALQLTLKEAVNMALRQNPEVAIANLNLAESQQNQNIARSGLLPQISFSASDKVTRGNIQALLGKKIPGFPQHNGPFWTIQAGPGFSTPLFDLTAWRRWQAAREAVGVSAAEETTAREQNAQLVVSQYLGALRAAADVKAAQSRMDLADSLVKLAADLQSGGVGTGIDTLRARVQYQNERQRWTEAQAQHKIALFGLARLLNVDPSQPIELTDETNFFETPSFSAQATIADAYAERPEMIALAAQIRTTEFGKRAVKSERMPRLSLNGGWTLQGISPTTMIPVYQFGAALDIPLFTGGRIAAETAVADIQLKKLAQAEQNLRNQIALEVNTSLAQLDAARVEVEAANLGVTLSTETVTQAQDRFRAGVANNIEVITAQDELARANDNQITALYRYNQARADLARATGRMESLYAR